jgi:photosystem II stability/assembly factor-like uncharacterized protein
MVKSENVTVGSRSAIQWTPLGEPGVGGFVVAVSVSPFDHNRVLTAGDMLGVALSTDGGATWQATQGFTTWEMASFTWHPYDPNIVWAGSMSGPYKSTDGGRTWVSMRNGMPPVSDDYYSVPIEKILFDPADSNHLLAFGGSHIQFNVWYPGAYGAVWHSRDGGNTWTSLSQVGSGAEYGVMAASYSAGPPYVLYAAINTDGVFKSVDNGATWTPTQEGLPSTNASYVVADPWQEKTAYASFFAEGYNPGGVYKTTDGGVTWNPANNGLGQLEGDPNDYGKVSTYAVVGVAPSSPNLLFTADLSWWNTQCYRSLNAAESWQPLPEPNHFYQGTSSAYDVGIDPRDASHAFVGTEAIINVTTNAGTSWTDATAVDVSGIFWRGTGFSGLVATNLAFDPPRERTVLMAMDDGKWVESLDQFNTWKWGGNGLNRFDGGGATTFSADGQTIYATFGQDGSYDGVAKSTDAGMDWTYLTTPVTQGNPVGVYALPKAPNNVWFTANGLMYASTDGGQSWSMVTSNGIDQDGGLQYIVGDPACATTFYVNGAAGIWKTTDGVTFQLMAGSPQLTYRMIVDPTKHGRLYVTVWETGNGDGLYKFDEGVWSLVRADYAMAGVAVDPSNGDRIVISTDDDPYHDVSAASGVYLSEDGGVTWTQQNTGLAVLRGSVIAFVPWNPRQVIFGATGRGFWLGEFEVTWPSWP